MKDLKNLLIENLYTYYEDELVNYIFDPQENEDDVYILGEEKQLVLSPYDSEGTIRVLVEDSNNNELMEAYFNVAELILCELDSFLKMLD